MKLGNGKRVKKSSLKAKGVGLLGDNRLFETGGASFPLPFSTNLESCTSVQPFRQQRSSNDDPWTLLSRGDSPSSKSDVDTVPNRDFYCPTEWDDSSWREHDLPSTAGRGRHAGVPVYIMLPLDSITMANTISRPRAFKASLVALKSAGIEGVMMDVWWGIVEKDGPGLYDWSAYIELVALVKEAGLKIQAVMSFHQCGGNVGDHCM